MSNGSKKQRVYRSAAAWRELLARFDASELTVVDFCREQRLSASNFYRWRQGLSSRKQHSTRRRRVSVVAQAAMPPPAFVELPVVPPPGFTPPPRWHIELDLGDGVVLRIAR